MTIDWKKSAQAYKEAYLKDLKELISINSVRDDEHKTDEYPLGEGPTKAMLKFLSFGERDGFTTKNIDNIVGYIEYGSGDQTMAMQAHADVMPAGDGWETNPFEMVEKDGKVYGRGTSDDKGPALASYYGLKMLKDNGIVPNMKIRLIIGTDEESEWTGMKHYFEVEPEPTFGFSPDAEFPLINGEKGNATYVTTFGNTNGSDYTLKKFDSGLRLNMVPGAADALVEVSDNEKFVDAFTKFLDQNPIAGDVKATGAGIALHITGKAAHAMEPKNGVNAGTYMAKFLNEFAFEGAAKEFVRFLAEDLHDDSRAVKIGAAHKDDIMGELTMNVGIMKFDMQNGGSVNTNFRYPKGTDDKEILAKLEAAAGKLNGTVKEINNMVTHYVDPSDPIVSTLMHVYQEQTGDMDSKPEVVGGGTYARLMKRGVAFGALFPNAVDTMHQANEFQPIDDLIKAMAIYGQSIYELTAK
ncbi:dipeptidase PepV [Lentilactobacillus otakiensis]|uniref:Dipeptidase PepV n=1 Tax=Lentilactobacillus otakiensis DSM 19908 = JCM 15040 TaxID=1423780 RepID=S4PN23_9LACO|nr:dipeptidase PepV [Lentilactobacillus otakiensis]KRL09363.1 dipeptidase [Lentilactobacillus otakiensis DSM 19908 = JCM 15040]MBZ3776584.1 dipeptidase PepV [Lentilactobacillus otakiensis]MDV3517497.1 dipeptidase PepV [Lentilactobacillus otakiensis]GAD15630.1 dipeptidase PepV [Lentilactobacillus otakiensis DSM 19908 = JCM 15040]